VHVGSTVSEVVTAASFRPAQSLARVVDVPAPLADVVDRALLFDTRERFADAREMREALLEGVAALRAT
jgi:hypothetical protein